MNLRLKLVCKFVWGVLCLLNLNCFAQKQESANFQMDMEYMRCFGKEVYLNNGGSGFGSLISLVNSHDANLNPYYKNYFIDTLHRKWKCIKVFHDSVYKANDNVGALLQCGNATVKVQSSRLVLADSVKWLIDKYGMKDFGHMMDDMVMDGFTMEEVIYTRGEPEKIDKKGDGGYALGYDALMTVYIFDENGKLINVLRD